MKIDCRIIVEYRNIIDLINKPSKRPKYSYDIEVLDIDPNYSRHLIIEVFIPKTGDFSETILKSKEIILKGNASHYIHFNQASWIYDERIERIYLIKTETKI